MVYLKSVENVITLGKLIGLLYLFCLPLLSILFLKTKRNDLARPVIGTIFLVYISMSVCMSVVCQVTVTFYTPKRCKLHDDSYIAQPGGGGYGKTTAHAHVMMFDPLPVG